MEDFELEDMAACIVSKFIEEPMEDFTDLVSIQVECFNKAM